MRILLLGEDKRELAQLGIKAGTPRTSQEVEAAASMCVCGRSLRGPPGKDAQDPTKFAQPLGEASCSPCTAQGRGHTDGSWQVCVCVCVDTLAQLGHSCRTGHLL